MIERPVFGLFEMSLYLYSYNVAVRKVFLTNEMPAEVLQAFIIHSSRSHFVPRSLS